MPLGPLETQTSCSSACDDACRPEQDILSRFHGSWELRPRRDAAGNIVGCHALLEQDVLPKGEQQEQQQAAQPAGRQLV